MAVVSIQYTNVTDRRTDTAQRHRPRYTYKYFYNRQSKLYRRLTSWLDIEIDSTYTTVLKKPFIFLLPNLCDGKLSIISGTDKLSAVFRERHEILRLNEHNEPSRSTNISNVLMLLKVSDHSQT